MSSVRVERQVERIASLGLSGASPELIDLDQVESDGAELSLLSLLGQERILGVAARGIDEGAIVGADDQMGQIIDRHDEVMRQSMRIERQALLVSGLLADAGIDHRLLKGAALAHSITTRSADRSFRDVDVLVSSNDINAAVSLLVEAGADRPQPELRPGYDSRFAKSVTLNLGGVEIDVHRLLCPGPFGVWMRPDELFLLPRAVQIGGVDVPTLDATDHLVHACYHVALGQVTPVLANLRDIALLAEMPTVDFERFDETVTRWRGGAAVKRAVRIVQARLDVDLPDELTSHVHRAVPADELDQLVPYLTDGGSGRFAALAPATLKALPLADRAAYALAVGLPDGADAIGRVKDILRRR